MHAEEIKIIFACSHHLKLFNPIFSWQENSEWTDWHANVLTKRNAVENVYQWACGWVFYADDFLFYSHFQNWLQLYLKEEKMSQ